MTRSMSTTEKAPRSWSQNSGAVSGSVPLATALVSETEMRNLETGFRKTADSPELSPPPAGIWSPSREEQRCGTGTQLISSGGVALAPVKSPGDLNKESRLPQSFEPNASIGSRVFAAAQQYSGGSTWPNSPSRLPGAPAPWERPTS